MGSNDDLTIKQSSRTSHVDDVVDIVLPSSYYVMVGFISYIYSYILLPWSSIYANIVFMVSWLYISSFIN